MHNVSNRISLPSVHNYRTDKYENPNLAVKGETSIFMADLHSVHNSTHEIKRGSVLGRISDNLKQAWQGLQAPHNGQSSVDNGANEEETQPQEVFVQGEDLRLMAHNLSTSRGEEFKSDAWQGSLFKRVLVGISFLTWIGALGAGYKYFAGRYAFNANPAGNTEAFPFGTSVNPVAQQGSGGTLKDSFGNNIPTQSDNPGHSVRHRLSDLSEDTAPKPHSAALINNDVCSTQAMYDKCQTAHRDAAKRGIRISNLVLNVGKKPCYCPEAEENTRDENSPANAVWGHNYEFPTGYDPSGQSFIHPRTTREPPEDFFWGHNEGILTGYDPTLHQK